MRGIDVSSYQGKIDWSKVKPYIDFAIIRCAFGNEEDPYFERNTSECSKLNIPYGVYLYSNATNIDDIKEEILITKRLIENKKLEYPVFIDIESKKQKALAKEDLVELVNYYCDELEKDKYYVGIYASLDTFKSNLNSEELDKYDKWVALWGSDFSYEGKAGMWQNTSYEELSGIKGRVDGDIAFYNYPKIIRDANLNHLSDLKYKVGDKIFVTGSIYEDDTANNIIDTVCDMEYTIESIEYDKEAPYKISAGYVKNSSIYTKC